MSLSAPETAVYLKCVLSWVKCLSNAFSCRKKKLRKNLEALVYRLVRSIKAQNKFFFLKLVFKVILHSDIFKKNKIL